MRSRARAASKARQGSEQRLLAGRRPVVPSTGKNTVLLSPAISGLRPLFTAEDLTGVAGTGPPTGDRRNCTDSVKGVQSAPRPGPALEI